MALPISVGSGATLASNQLNGEHLQVISPVSLYPLPAGANYIGLASIQGTIDLGATDNAVLDTIAASAAAIETAVEGTLTVTGGGSTQYAEDTAHASGDTLTMAGVLQQASNSSTAQDGDRTVLQVNGGGRLKVVLDDNLIFPDDSGFTAESDSVIPMAGFFNDTTPDALSEGSVGVPRLSSRREQYTQIRDAAGNERGVNVTASNELNVLDSNSAAIKTAVETLDNVVSGSEAQVDVVAALPAGANYIGLASVNIGGALPALSAGANFIGLATVNVGAAIPAGTNAIGKLNPPDIDVTAHTNYAKKYYTSTGAATDGIIWSPAAGKRWHVVSMYLQTSAAATITLEDDKAGGDEAIWKGEFAANQGMTINFSEKYPLASGEDASDLTVTSTAGNIYITCTGYEV